MTNNNNQNNQNADPVMANNNQDDNNNQNNIPPFSSSRFNNNNNQNNPNQNSSGTRFGSSRFNNNNSRSGNSSRIGNNSNNQNNNSRFSSNRNRFGQQTIYWTVAPMTNAVVRISLDGLGDPFHRLLGMPLNVEYGQPEKVVEALQNDEDLLGKISKLLDEAWESYDFEGAALLFPWDEDVKKAYSQPVYPNDNYLPNNNTQNNNQNSNDNDDDYDNDESTLSDYTSNVACLRAIEPAFVLNILARSRANVVVGNTPLALEPGFLTQTVVCDDPRIVALARATGYIDENW